MVNEDKIPTHTGDTLNPALQFVLEHVNDPPFIPNIIHATELNISAIIKTEPTDLASSSNQALQPCAPINISS